MSNTGAVLSVCLALTVMAGCAPKPKEPGPSSWKGGKEFAPAKCVPIADLNRDAVKQVDKTVQITGTVTKVCQGSGCWVEVSDGKVALIAKSLGHNVLFPKDCVGKKVMIEGVVRLHPADECDMDAETKKDHECPKPEMLVEVLGARLY
ncbi:MAG: DUF4920 domain-containing protein [Planctomycetes bacterium]|nr:DUF4920 domain-containing protein [Planctomycetota bacterium]